jgi:hypothetical protein
MDETGTRKKKEKIMTLSELHNVEFDKLERKGWTVLFGHLDFNHNTITLTYRKNNGTIHHITKKKYPLK